MACCCFFGTSISSKKYKLNTSNLLSALRTAQADSVVSLVRLGRHVNAPLMQEFMAPPLRQEAEEFINGWRDWPELKALPSFIMQFRFCPVDETPC